MTLKVVTLPSSSKENLRVPVSTRPPTDPTTSTVTFAAVTANSNDPQNTDYSIAGAWDTDSGVYYARAMVGPLAEGRYDLWIRIVAGSEDVRRQVAVLNVT